MRNRFMIYRKGHSVASALLFVLLMAHLLLPPLAWLGSAAGFPLGNLFSSEGVRWYYLHIQDCYRSPFMAVVFPVVLVFGAIERSGLSEIIKDTITLGFVLTSLLYAVLSFHLRGWQECLSVLYWGIQRYDVWILISMLAAQLYNALCYVWNGA